MRFCTKLRHLSIDPTPQEDKAAIDALVDAFAAELRAKLHAKVDDGRRGWDDPDWDTLEIIRAMLEHVPKGDPIDVAAFAAFWWNRTQ